MDYLTGANGFLGKHLLEALGGKGFVKTIPHEDISTCKLEPFNNLFFLSTYGNMAFHDDIDATIQANLLDLLHIIKQVVSLNFKSFVYISTSSVKLDFQTPYSRAKRAAEEILLIYAEKYHLPISIIRPFSITGVGEQPEHLIPTLIKACYTGELVNFAPLATHDWIDVSDVVDGILCISKNSLRGVFELGNGKRYTNKAVLELVESITGKKVNINQVETMRPYDNPQWFSCNYKVRGWGWQPRVSLRESIKQQVKVYKEKK